MAVPPRKLAKRKKVDEVKPISGLDIEALLLKGKEADEAEGRAKRQKVEIGLEDPSQDFKRMIENEEISWKPGYLAPASLNESVQRNGTSNQRRCLEVVCRSIIRKGDQGTQDLSI